MNEKPVFKIFLTLLTAILAFAGSFVLYLFQQHDIEKKTVETLSGYFEEVDKDMSYSDAIKFLYESSQTKDRLIESLRAENAELNSLKEQVTSEEINREIIDSATSFAESEDYAMAYAVLSSITKKTPQITVMAQEYQRKYEAQVIIEADSLISNGEYEEAQKVIDNALKVITDSSILKEKKASIKNAKPQKFMNIFEPHEASYYYKKANGDTMQMAGQKYYDGFELGHSRYVAYATFNLKEKYTEITGHIGHLDGTGGETNILRIIAENDRVIETIEIPNDGLPQDFSIPVSGVNLLRFERTAGYGQTCLADIMIR